MDSSPSKKPSPQRVGRYVLYDAIASGGMASVYLARQHGAIGFSRIVAVKRIHPHFAREADFVAMFLDEARLASRIQHANVVAPLDVVTEGSEVLLVLEYVTGESLDHLLRASAARGEQAGIGVALRIASDALHGLGAAHQARDEKGQLLHLVHRDVSPHNVLVGVDGVARVADFGVAKAVGRLQTTRSGELKGKLGYMAPEQLRGQRVSVRSDVYSAGVTLWELLAGRQLIEADTEAEIVLAAVSGPQPRLLDQRPDLPEDLCRVVERAIQRDPEQRYESALAFAEALEGVAPLASAGAVSRWVSSLAAESLAYRTQLIQFIEQQEGLPPSRRPPPSSKAANSTVDHPGQAPSQADPRQGTPLGLARTSGTSRARRATSTAWILGGGLLLLAFALALSRWFAAAEPSNAATGEAPEQPATGDTTAPLDAPRPAPQNEKEAVTASPRPATESPVDSPTLPAPAGTPRSSDVAPDGSPGAASPPTTEPTKRSAPPLHRPTPQPKMSPKAPAKAPEESPKVVPDDLLGRH